MTLEIHSSPTCTDNTCTVSKTCSFSQLDKDDMVYMEAYDKLLESWLTLVQDEEHFPRGCFVQPAIQVFNSYIQCHLAAPDGTRNLVRPVFHHNVKNSPVCTKQCGSVRSLQVCNSNPTSPAVKPAQFGSLLKETIHRKCKRMCTKLN